MKFGWASSLSLVLLALLAGCVGSRQGSLPSCSPEQSYAQGQKDGTLGRSTESIFLRSCSKQSRDDAEDAYREGFEAVRQKKAHPKVKPEVEVEDEPERPLATAVPTFAPDRAPAAASWICEVEANSKIFTGVGSSKDEALGSARASCGSHLQASYCSNADCKQSL